MSSRPPVPRKAAASLRLGAGLPELVLDPIPPARVVPVELDVAAGDDAAGAAFQAAVQAGLDGAVLAGGPAAGGADRGQALQAGGHAGGVAHAHVRAALVHQVAVLEQLLFDFYGGGFGHRTALISLNASPIRPGSDRVWRKLRRI